MRQLEAKNKFLSSELAKEKENSSSNPPKNVRSANASAEVQPSLLHSVSSDVMSEVSYLSLTAAGERQYLGSTSGILFADLVRSSVNLAPKTLAALTVCGRVQAADSVENGRGAFASVAEALPPEALARKLIASYLAHDHLCYPFVLPTMLLSTVDSIYAQHSFYLQNHFEGFVFDMVLAIATANVYKFDWQILPAAESHHLRAMYRLTDVLKPGGINALQAILLLCQFRTGSSIQDNSASMWHLVGISVRMAYELGLHRESTYSELKIGSEDAASLVKFQNQETRRKCFWCVLAMDRVVSITLGRPLGIRLEDFDVALPSKEHDEVFYSGLPQDLRSESVNRTAIFVHIIHYRLLCGRIMSSLHCTRSTKESEKEIRALRESLVTDLEYWKTKTNELGLPDVDLTSSLPEHRSSFRSKEWYEILYNNAQLLLFRPSPMLCDISYDSISLQRIFRASQQAVLLYSYLHRSQKLNYSWITLHSVFMAGLSYIYAVSRHFRARRKGIESPRGATLLADPTVSALVNDTRACSNVLVAVSERWNTLRSCTQVFDRLSDAVLADAIKIQCTPAPQPDIQQNQLHQAYSDIGEGPSSYNITAAPPPSQTHSTSYQSTMSSTQYNPVTNNSWQQGTMELGAMDTGTGFFASTSPLAVDCEFRNSFDDLQHLYDQQYVDDPVMQLSYDWLGHLDGRDIDSEEINQTRSGNSTAYNTMGS